MLDTDCNIVSVPFPSRLAWFPFFRGNKRNQNWKTESHTSLNFIFASSCAVMMEAGTVSETLYYNAILTRLIAGEDFHYIQSPRKFQILFPTGPAQVSASAD
jgi:hypothetical protein